MDIPFSAPHDFKSSLQKDESKKWEELWFIFKDSHLLIDEKSKRPFQDRSVVPQSEIYMGTYQKMHLKAVQTSSPAPKGAVWADLKTLFEAMDPAFFALAGRASELIYWDTTHQYCSRCGAKTITMENERAKSCPKCHLLAFPKISPVMIALVQRGEELLLARGRHFPLPFYSALAGFVDPGETLEDCVKREVFEEVGVEVDQIRYFGSQPWPFPHSLMIAFTCQWKRGEIKIDPSEIVDAQWFTKDNLPELPHLVSIGRLLIDAIIRN